MKYDTHFDLVPISDILPTISAKAMWKYQAIRWPDHKKGGVMQFDICKRESQEDRSNLITVKSAINYYSTSKHKALKQNSYN